METGTRAERADEGTSVGLGSKNGLRDPRENKKKEEKAGSGAGVGLGSENELRGPRKQNICCV